MVKEMKRLEEVIKEAINKEGFILGNDFLSRTPFVITDGGNIVAIIYNLSPEEWVEVIFRDGWMTITALAEYEGCRHTIDQIEVEL